MTSIMALFCAAMAGQQFQSSFVTSAPSTGAASETCCTVQLCGDGAMESDLCSGCLMI